MSSTSGIQNLLVNVFRPVYTYDTTTSLFTPKLELSNVDTYSGNSVAVFSAAVGDSASNVYVGSNAGNVYSNVRACSNVTAIGYGAGSNISNVSNSTYLGFYAGSTDVCSSVVIGIGVDAGGGGVSNIFLGNGTRSTGSSNILIGHGINLGAGSNTLRVGSTVYGDLSKNWIGVGINTQADSNTRLDVSGNTYIKGQVGVNITPGTRTLDVNGDFRASDANGTLDFNLGSFTVTAAFKRTLAATAVTQPIIQYGKTSGSGTSGSVSVTLPTAYSNTTYVAQVTMEDTTATPVSVNITASNAFTIYWSGGGAGSHTLGWTTYGT